MKSKLLVSALLALSVGLPVAQAAEDAPEAGVKPAIESVTLVTLSATVASIDHETRQVTLKDAEGNETTFTVGDEVRNLSQVEVGDQVDIAYYESVDIQVLSPEQAEPGAAALSALETAEPGQKPAGQLTTGISLVATIEALDKAAETVTLKGPAGNTRTVKVRDPANLEKVAVGDRVLIDLTQSIAVEVKEQAAQQ